MFLMDTDMLSALRRRDRHPDAVHWLESQRTSDLYLSVVTIGEIERGITQQQRRDPAFARDLVRWLDRVLALYGDRVLSVDLQRLAVGGSYRRPLGTRRRPARCRHGLGARAGGGHPQRPALRACWRASAQPFHQRWDGTGVTAAN